MKKAPKAIFSLILMITIVSLQSISFMDSNDGYEKYDRMLQTSISDYTLEGFTVPDIEVIYVGSLGGSTLAKYTSGVLYLVRSDDDVMLNRVIRHEIAHAITGKLIEDSTEELEAYWASRIGGYKQTNAFYNLTAEQLDFQMRLYSWNTYTLTIEELSAEDVYFTVYALPTMQSGTIGTPTPQQIEALKRLILGY